MEKNFIKSIPFFSLFIVYIMKSYPQSSPCYSKTILYGIFLSSTQKHEFMLFLDVRTVLMFFITQFLTIQMKEKMSQKSKNKTL